MLMMMMMSMTCMKTDWPVVAVEACVAVLSDDKCFTLTLPAGEVTTARWQRPICITVAAATLDTLAVPTGNTVITASPADIRLTLALTSVSVTHCACGFQRIAVAWIATDRISRVQVEKLGFALIALYSYNQPHNHHYHCQHAPHVCFRAPQFQ